VDYDNQNKPTAQIAKWLQGDLRKLLIKRGKYEARIISSADDFRKGQDEYLIDIKIMRYNPGSKAARIIVGFGAGSASLDIHYELIGPSGKTLLSKDDGCGTSLDWQRLARKLNENILSSIKPVIAEGDTYTSKENEEEETQVSEKSDTLGETEEVFESDEEPDKQNVSDSSKDPSIQLKTLKKLYDDGLINDEEYAAKKQEILNKI
ncbi:MAG: hypothetical protein ACD_79C01467G0001, partial [uncultured bacterium]